MKQTFSVRKVVLSIRGKVYLLFFPVFIGYIFKGTGGASVQWVGSLKKKKGPNESMYIMLLHGFNIAK